MADYDTIQLDQMAERRGVDGQVLVLIEARNQQTGATEAIGLWTGDDNQTFVVDGETHTFLGAGAVINIPPIRAGTGFQVRRHRISLPPMLDEVRTALQVYQAAQARVRVWSQPMNIDTGAPLGTPKRVIKGRLEQAPETLAKRGDSSETVLVVSTGVRRMTFKQPVYKSDAALRQRNPADRFREYIDNQGEKTVPWGQASARGAPPSPPVTAERTDGDVK